MSQSGRMCRCAPCDHDPRGKKCDDMIHSHLLFWVFEILDEITGGTVPNCRAADANFKMKKVF